MARINENLQSTVTLPKSISGGTSVALVVVFAIAALYIGRDIFVPLTLAILLSFMLSPLLSWLQRHRVPRIPAVFGVVAVALIIIGGFGLVIVERLIQLAENLPSYQSNIQAKIRSVKIIEGPESFFGPISEMFRELGDEVSRPAESAPPVETSPPYFPGDEGNAVPVPVEIVVPDLSSLQLVETIIGPLITPLITVGITITFVIFILLYRHDLRDRLIRLASLGDLNRTTEALEDASSRVAKYLLAQVIVNLSYGIPIGVGLWLIGVPNSLLWGMLAFLLRFIPYIGPILAAMFPIALSIAVDPGWTMLLWTVSLFATIEVVSNNIVEPWVYGAKTGLSPIAIIAAAIFWTWLWGPAGLLLSTPLTVCLFVLGRHVPQFAFLDVSLGSERALTHEVSLRQRLLALDPDEATENAKEYLREHSLEEFYDKVAFPAFASIEDDRVRGVLDEDRHTMVTDTITIMIDNLSNTKDLDVSLSETRQLESQDQAKSLSNWPISADRQDSQVLCAGARGNLDDVAAEILAQLLERRGVASRVLPGVGAETGATNLARADIAGIRMVCFLYLTEHSIVHARDLIRRLHRSGLAVPILVAFLSPSAARPPQISSFRVTKANLFSTSLVDALDQISAAWREFEETAIGRENTSSDQRLSILAKS